MLHRGQTSWLSMPGFGLESSGTQIKVPAERVAGVRAVTVENRQAGAAVGGERIH